MRYGKKEKKNITHFGEQAGGQAGREVWRGGLNGRGEISGEQGMGCAREGWWLGGGGSRGQGREGSDGGVRGCELETCFEILILGSGRGLEHRDGERKKKRGGGGAFEARECSMHSWRRRCTDGHVGGEQLGQVWRFSLSSPVQPWWYSVHLEHSTAPALPSPDTNETCGKSSNPPVPCKGCERNT